MVLYAAVGALVSVALAGRVRADIGPFSTMLSARPALRGHTTLQLAPLGSIRLDTHGGPVAVELSVDELRVEEAARIARDPSILEGLQDDIADDAQRALLRLGRSAIASTGSSRLRM